MAGPVTSLNVRLGLVDHNFGRGLFKAEQSATKFSKSVTKVGNSVGAFAALSAQAEGLAHTTGQAESSLGMFATRLSSTSGVLTAGTTLVFGLKGAFDALKASLLANPIGIVIAGAAAGAGILLSIFRQTRSAVADTRSEIEKLEQSTSEWERKFGQGLRRGQEASKATKERNKEHEEQLSEAERKQKMLDDVRTARDKLRDPVEGRKRELVRGGHRLREAEIQVAEEEMLAEDQRKREEKEKQLHELEQARAELAKGVADLEREANEAWLSDNERKVNRLEELAQKTGELFDREKALRNLEASQAPEKMRKQAADVERRIKELEAKEKELSKQQGKVQLDNPQALLKGTAEAELAQDRAKNQVEKMTDEQKKTLAEIKRQKKMLQTKLDQLIDAQKNRRVVAIP